MRDDLLAVPVSHFILGDCAAPPWQTIYSRGLRTHCSGPSIAVLRLCNNELSPN